MLYMHRAWLQKVAEWAFCITVYGGRDRYKSGREQSVDEVSSMERYSSYLRGGTKIGFSYDLKKTTAVCGLPAYTVIDV